MFSDDDGSFTCGERSEDSQSEGSLKDFIVDSDDESFDDESDFESSVVVEEAVITDDDLDEENMFESSVVRDGRRCSTRVKKKVSRYIESVMTDPPIEIEDSLSDTDPDIESDEDEEFVPSDDA